MSNYPPLASGQIRLNHYDELYMVVELGRAHIKAGQILGDLSTASKELNEKLR